MTRPAPPDPGPADGAGEVSHHERTSAPWLLLATVVLTALNLRAAVTSVGPLLREMQASLGMSDTVAGVLTTLPVVGFGFVGLLAGRAGRRFGAERTLVAGLVLLVVGLVVRAASGSVGVLLAASAVAVVGIAVANVLVPVAVKRWFPDKVGRVTGLYSMSMAVGASASAALTVPLAQSFGGWRAGLGLWALPAVVALVPWLAVLRDRTTAMRNGAEPSPHQHHLPVHRSVQAWALAVFFGIQSLGAYVTMGWLPAILQDAGVAPATAGVLLGVTIGLGAPVSILLPELAARRPDQRPWVVGLIGVLLSAYLGLILAPAAAPLLWSILLGIGLGAFPLALVLIGLRAATSQGTSDLSALAQGVGYLIAATGPLTVGVLHDLTGGWDVPLWLLVGLLAPKLAAGWLAARPGHVDAEVATGR